MSQVIEKQLKELKDLPCPVCGKEMEWASAYCASDQEFWFAGICSNDNCGHQMDIKPTGWERE